MVKQFFRRRSSENDKKDGWKSWITFGIFPVTLKPGVVHVLGDVLSRAPHVEGEAVVNDVKVQYMKFSNMISKYNAYQFFGMIVKSLNVDWPIGTKERLKLEKSVLMFNL